MEARPCPFGLLRGTCPRLGFAASFFWENASALHGAIWRFATAALMGFLGCRASPGMWRTSYERKQGWLSAPDNGDRQAFGAALIRNNSYMPTVAVLVAADAIISGTCPPWTATVDADL
jgi:hypothetical protein